MSAGLYRIRAKDCSEKAELVGDPRKRAGWLSLAQQWQRLAVEVEMRQLDLWGVCERPDVFTTHAQAFAVSAGTLRQH
jgi:hypothetical protein